MNKKFNKTVLALALTASLGFGGHAAFAAGTPAAPNATGNMRTYTDNMLDRMNNYTTNRTGYGYGGNYDTNTYRTNNYRTTATNNNNWGWLGLLGLIGLAGLRNRNERRDDVR